MFFSTLAIAAFAQITAAAPSWGPGPIKGFPGGWGPPGHGGPPGWGPPGWGPPGHGPPPPPPAGWVAPDSGFFANHTILNTTGSVSCTYPRGAQYADGTLIAMAACSGHSPNYFPVFESRDSGSSWTYISNFTDQVNGWGMSAQPALEVLTAPIGGFPAGTVLGTGNSWSSNGTRIDLYVRTANYQCLNKLLLTVPTGLHRPRQELGVHFSRRSRHCSKHH